MRNDEVLRLLRSINDINLGAPVTDAHLDDIETWIRLEQDHGSSDGGAFSIVRALVRELRDARGIQPNVTEAPKRRRRKNEEAAENEQEQGEESMEEQAPIIDASEPIDEATAEEAQPEPVGAAPEQW
jgi:hypothetical protein